MIWQKLKATCKWGLKNYMSIVQVVVLVVSILYLVYALGYTTTWAYVVTEEPTRGQEFFRLSQQINRIIAKLAFATLIIVLVSMMYGSISRKKYYVSNIVLSVVSSVMLIVSGVYTIYLNQVGQANYETVQISQLYYDLHRTSYTMISFEIGNSLSMIMIIVGVLLIVSMIIKLIAQHERKIIIERLVSEHAKS